MQGFEISVFNNSLTLEKRLTNLLFLMGQNNNDKSRKNIVKCDEYVQMIIESKKAF